MKKILVVPIMIAALLLNSCEPAATFDKPQPDNVRSLETFPVRLHGKYLAADQASVLMITDHLLTRFYDFDLKEHKDSFDSSYQLAGDTLIDQRNGTKEKILVQGDTVIRHINGIDTMFCISPDNVLKKFKGRYFLNKRYKDNAWEVNMLSLENGELTVGSIVVKEDLQKLRELTEAAADTTTTHFTLNRRQFKNFVRQNGFAEQETFRRMAESGK